MIRFLLPLAAMGLLGVAGLVLLDRLITRPGLGAAIVVGAVIADTALAPSLMSVELASIRVSLIDPVFGLVAAAGVARYLRARRISWLQAAVLLLAGLAVLSTGRGLLEFGEAAGREFREYLTFLGGAVYFSSFPLTRHVRESVGRAFLVGATVLAGVVLVRWGATFLGLPAGPLAAQFSHPIRALSGPESYFFGEALLIAIPAWAGREFVERQRWLALLFLLFSVALNRRTMWVALIAGLATFAVRDRDWARRMGALLAGLAVVGTLAVLALPDDTLQTDEAVAASATNTGTLNWRVAGWTDLLSQPRSNLDWLVGEPMGAGFEREVSGVTLESNPHSFYVQTLLRLGLLGVAAQIVLYAACARRLWRRRAAFEDPGLLTPQVLLALLVAHMVWSITWPTGSEQGLLLGLAVAAASVSGARRRSPPAALAPSPTRPDPPGLDLAGRRG